VKIFLNNNHEEFDREALTVSELLVVKNYTFKMLVIKINGNLVSKAAYDTTEIHDGDEVHVLHLISGG